MHRDPIVSVTTISDSRLAMHERRQTLASMLGVFVWAIPPLRDYLSRENESLCRVQEEGHLQSTRCSSVFSGSDGLCEK